VVRTLDLRLSVASTFSAVTLPGHCSEIGDRLCRVKYLGIQLSPRSTQPCIPPGSLNRVPALAGENA